MTKDIQKDQYPWSHLFVDISSELPVDPQELLATQQFTQAELSKQTQLVQTQQQRLSDMQSISTKTFDTLSAKLKELTDENASLVERNKKLEQINQLTAQQSKDQQDVLDLTNQKMEAQKELLAAATEELQKHNDEAQNELVYQIIINYVMHHKAGLSQTVSREKTFHNILVWLHQRKNVVKYLRRNKLVPKVSDDLENILFVDERTLNDLMNQLTF